MFSYQSRAVSAREKTGATRSGSDFYNNIFFNSQYEHIIFPPVITYII